MSVELVMPSKSLILCYPFLLLPLNAKKNVDKGLVPEIEPWPVIFMEEHEQSVVGEPGRALRLESTLCAANTYLPNICFLCIAFLLTEVPKHYPQHPLVSLAESGI